MEFEYVAVEWRVGYTGKDEGFATTIAGLLRQGWEEHSRAFWRSDPHGGACIMRRPKDEPQERETPDKLYNKYCVIKEDGNPVDPNAQYFVLRLDTDECARQAAAKYALCCESKGIQRGLSRDLHQLVSRLGRAADERPKDEPRMLTEGEIEGVVKRLLAHDKDLRKELVGLIKRLVVSELDYGQS